MFLFNISLFIRMSYFFFFKLHIEFKWTHKKQLCGFGVLRIVRELTVFEIENKQTSNTFFVRAMPPVFSFSSVFWPYFSFQTTKYAVICDPSTKLHIWTPTYLRSDHRTSRVGSSEPWKSYRLGIWQTRHSSGRIGTLSNSPRERRFMCNVP